MIEHGAYGLLLDRCYATEQGIPDGQAHRLTRARTPAEKAAVDSVLAEFFTLVDGHWMNRRVTGEIDKAHRRIGAAKENGKRGGRPKKERSGSENETQQKPNESLEGSENETQQKPNESLEGSENETQQKPSGLLAGSENETQQKAYHTPYTIHHINTTTDVVVLPHPQENPPETQLAPSPTRVGLLCRQLRTLGIDAAPHLQAWTELLPRYSDEQIIACAEAVRDAKPGQRIHLNYLLPKLADAATPKAGTKANPRQPKAENFAGIDYGNGGKL